LGVVGPDDTGESGKKNEKESEQTPMLIKKGNTLRIQLKVPKISGATKVGNLEKVWSLGE